MKRLMVVGLVALSFVIAGCSNQPTKEGNREKAAEVNADMGLRYMLRGNYEVAMEKLNRSLELNPSYPNAHHYLAELYRRLERFDEADKHFRKALSLAPNDSALQNNYGVFLCDRGRIEESERQFLKVLDNPVYPERAQAYENLGLCMERKPDGAKAERYFKQALGINPKLPNALVAMARRNYDQGNFLSARAYLQRYLEVGRHTAETLWLGIRIERILGDRNALASYELSLRNNFPESQEARLLKAERQ